MKTLILILQSLTLFTYFVVICVMLNNLYISETLNEQSIQLDLEHKHHCITDSVYHAHYKKGYNEGFKHALDSWKSKPENK